MKILILEDETGVIKLIADVLTRIGFKNLILTTTIAQAEKELKLNRPDLFIADGDVDHEGDGADMAVRLHDAGIPTLIVSGRSENARPPIPFLPKPFTPRQLREQVAQALEK